MTPDITYFLAAGALLILGAIWREVRVPAAGTVRRGPTAWLVTAGLLVTVVLAAVYTWQRLTAMAL